MAHPNNTAPEGFREVTESEFAQNLSSVAIKGSQEYKQLTTDFAGHKFDVMIRVYLFTFYDGTGVGMETVYNYGGGDGGNFSLRYYAFGCDHSFEEISVTDCKARDISHYGMFCHVYECSKCGRLEQVDSSG